MFIGGNKMIKLSSGTLFLAMMLVWPVTTTARVNVSVDIALPPLIVFASPPEMVVIPETNVYAVPDLDVDIFFYNGWWWRPWEGRWYRSRDYGSGWGYYRYVPSFYGGVPRRWKNDYRQNHWKGRQWNHQRVSHEQVQKNWRHWEKSRHWEKQNSWGVQGLKPRAESRQKSSQVRQQQRPAQPQSREALKPQHSPSRQEKHERGREEKQGRK